MTLPAGGVATFQAPNISPAYLGVGYIIGPELGALNFAGGLLAWGLFVPLLVYLLGPQIARQGRRQRLKVDDAFWAAQVVESGCSLCVPSPWAECSSGRRPRSTRCARTSPRAWAAP